MTPNPSTSVPGQERLFGRDYTLTVLGTFFFMLNFTTFYLLPLFIQQIGGNETDIGFVSGSGWIISFICTPFSGVLVDRWGAKRLLLAGAALLGVGAAGYLFVQRVGPLIYLLRALQGVGLAAGLTAGYTLVAELSPASRRGESYGFYMVFTLSPHAIGPWAGEGLVSISGFPALFGAAAAYALLSVLLGAFIRGRADGSDPAPSSSLSALLVRRDLWPVMWTVMLTGSSFGAVLTFVPTYLKSRGFETIGFFFVTYTVVAVLIRIFLTGLSDRWGRRRILLPNLLGMAVVLVLLALARDLWGFVAAAFFFGTSQGFVMPTLGALVIDRANPSDRGRTMGLFSGFFHLGVFLNSTALGGVAARFGYPVVYWIAAAMALGGLAFFARFDPSRSPEPDRVGPAAAP